jgi:hypothetical protein
MRFYLVRSHVPLYVSLWELCYLQEETEGLSAKCKDVRLLEGNLTRWVSMLCAPVVLCKDKGVGKEDEESRYRVQDGARTPYERRGREVPKRKARTFVCTPHRDILVIQTNEENNHIILSSASEVFGHPLSPLSSPRMLDFSRASVSDPPRSSSPILPVSTFSSLTSPITTSSFLFLSSI